MLDLFDPTKMVIIAAIALLVIDPKKLPQVSRRLGRTMRDVRLAAHNLTREFGAEELVEDLRGLNQARSSLGETVRRELGLDEIAQSMNLDGQGDKSATSAKQGGVPEATPSKAEESSPPVLTA
jgi:Sec-independent protein translocase protein TatA